MELRDVNRDDLVRRFERWLDDVLSAEDPPVGIDSEMLAALDREKAETSDALDRSDDAYTLSAAMTALTHEIKLQGRAFKELHTSLGTQPGRIVDEMCAAAREREREVRREAERRSRREMLSTLIDVRDRLGRGLESVRAVEAEVSRRAGRRWLTRVFATGGTDPHAETLAAVTIGYELGLDRLDQTLDECNARPIRCEGQRFDPRRMNAIDMEESSVVPDGTVLEVYRTGYEWGDDVFRPAQVKVSRDPAAGRRHE